MKRKMIAIVSVAALLAAPAAFAAEGTVTGAAGGAVTGAVVGGPVGAAVGGVAGAIVGTVIAPPTEVRQYVVEAPPPAAPAPVATQVTVGSTLPDTVVVYQVPDYPAYEYTIIDGHRVIVDAETRQVVEIID